MSGDVLSYERCGIERILEKIDEVISLNKVEIPKDKLSPYGRDCDDDGPVYHYDYDDDTIDKIRCIRNILLMSKVAAKRLDYLLSRDDGEESFRERFDAEILDAITNFK